jgi:hypothetical protein
MVSRPPARECFEDIVRWLDGDQSAHMDHGELECQLDAKRRRP